MSYNDNGLKYFVYNTTKNSKYYFELPLDIRKNNIEICTSLSIYTMLYM